mmetsp:Transcript_8680/g.19695  ORF Transcript_8680/g.19695 Transcript_8680/m.19695 type:complete len:701 (-) Transcript_8680:150-2252(-)
MDSVLDAASPNRLSYKESKDFMSEHVDLMVKTLDKKEFYLQVRSDIEVSELKKEVASTTSIAVESQRLMSAGSEMLDSKKLSDYSRSPSQIIYLVVKFPGAAFAAPQQDNEDELPTTAGEESVMRSSRIVLRGTVTIPVPEREMHRVVHRILHRGNGTPNLQEIMSSISYIPRNRRHGGNSEVQSRRNFHAGSLLHRRQRRRRIQHPSAAGIPVSFNPSRVNQFIDLPPRTSHDYGAMTDSDWSEYFDLELQPGMLSDVYESYDDPIDERLDDYARSSTYMVDQESELGLDDLVNDDNGLVLLENSVVERSSLRNSGDDLRSFSHDLNDLENRLAAQSLSGSRATMVETGAPDGSGAGEGGGMDIWSEGRMSRKRKHSEICGEYTSEQRLTARCRSQTLGEILEESASGAEAAGICSGIQREEEMGVLEERRSTETEGSTVLDESSGDRSSVQATSADAETSTQFKDLRPEEEEEEESLVQTSSSAASSGRDLDQSDEVRTGVHGGRQDDENKDDCLVDVTECKEDEEDEEEGEQEGEEEDEEEEDEEDEVEMPKIESQVGCSKEELASVITSASSPEPSTLQRGAGDSEIVASGSGSSGRGLQISMEPFPRSISIPREMVKEDEVRGAAEAEQDRKPGGVVQDEPSGSNLVQAMYRTVPDVVTRREPSPRARDGKVGSCPAEGGDRKGEPAKNKCCNIM